MVKQKMSPMELKKYCDALVSTGKIFKAMETMDVKLIPSGQVPRGKPLIVFNPELMKPAGQASLEAKEEHEKPDHATVKNVPREFTHEKLEEFPPKSWHEKLDVIISLLEKAKNIREGSRRDETGRSSSGD